MTYADIDPHANSIDAGNGYRLEVEDPTTQASFAENCSTMIFAIDRAERLLEAGYRVQIRGFILPEGQPLSLYPTA